MAEAAARRRSFTDADEARMFRSLQNVTGGHATVQRLGGPHSAAPLLYERERAPPGLPTQSSDEKKAALAAQNARAGKSESEAAEEKLSDEAAVAAARAARARPAGVASEEQQAAGLRAQIADEIAERQHFLDEMAALGRGDKSLLAQLRGEIAERVRDLARLDAMCL
ncbi:hypothetical protein EMIHUDRAFT_244599 [Emiliania huxleyi CCMP1516]|uniref:Uncharacterized protein n=2 Tax=Emiliania huxleyi TaxID=2903 RepID=A0A0D3HYZ5_EMIH1|nr:hypothetical protein EMIHUDRAFT_221336 [Emiliania huxleyi CCMP1516]XP_005769422.1 hypothetical protein EMIHUDRAFT_244599 [Emiliania huxleyi CCMP1516]EOD04230.1 hypothetical protein EMIHUDRAFT_221336 [Emiliania huxleyi CCMP1516]EOD16993.1 hypothetical protein EMIHUDRAFT_244599 [Emiliania huxleyi CCMP1516]|eukprot:XP_005756659.1 hypothetical protein EMIHUDRAFT_221336 [Emiliania huxleyi CCMP1516]